MAQREQNRQPKKSAASNSGATGKFRGKGRSNASSSAGFGKSSGSKSSAPGKSYRGEQSKRQGSGQNLKPAFGAKSNRDNDKGFGENAEHKTGKSFGKNARYGKEQSSGYGSGKNSEHRSYRKNDGFSKEDGPRQRNGFSKDSSSGEGFRSDKRGDSERGGKFKGKYGQDTSRDNRNNNRNDNRNDNRKDYSAGQGKGKRSVRPLVDGGTPNGSKSSYGFKKSDDGKAREYKEGASSTFSREFKGSSPSKAFRENKYSDTPKSGGYSKSNGGSGRAESNPNKPASGRYAKSSFPKPRSIQMMKRIKVTETYQPFVVEPPCPVFDDCGGCQLQMFNNEGQLKYKYSKLIDLLGGFCKVEAIEGMENPYHYRHKTHASFAYSKGAQKKIIGGIYEENTHRIISTDNCLIQDERANAIINTITALMPSFKMAPYDEDRATGFLRHVLIRTSYAQEGVMVVLVGATPIFPAKRNFVRALTEKHPEIETIVYNINNRNTSMVLGEREEILFGKGYVEDILCGMTFKIAPKAFYQVNPEQTDKLYREAIKMAELTGKEHVLDAYSGLGTIGMIASQKSGKVICVENNREAVRGAIKSARENGVTNIYFHAADATEFCVSAAEVGERFDVVFMDPPRNGSTPEFIQALGKMKPDRIVYVSCNPETLARDLELFKKAGYYANRIKPFDMFPWTEHVEAIILMTRSGSVEKK